MASVPFTNSSSSESEEVANDEARITGSPKLLASLANLNSGNDEVEPERKKPKQDSQEALSAEPATGGSAEEKALVESQANVNDFWKLYTLTGAMIRPEYGSSNLLTPPAQTCDFWSTTVNEPKCAVPEWFIAQGAASDDPPFYGMGNEEFAKMVGIRRRESTEDVNADMKTSAPSE